METNLKRHDAMTSAVKTSVRLAFLLAISLHAQQAPVENPVEIANDEAVRRQEATIQLHIKLDQARDAIRRNELKEAAKFYQEAVAQIPNSPGRQRRRGRREERSRARVGCCEGKTRPDRPWTPAT